ncbi:IS30 family transposase [Bacillus mesophilus]|uniref:DNA-binding protein n=1 Tax=Bacillus mesophilus TaxID=1808955 RepID=A0A6M0QBJ5_9BACI|nr:DNA-binding protein [Bacillus mesophilus]MBM7662971.1 IS30 family transposase [Bacillus mesophilus]NEY73703.1 DNA-binding protein [Bacillus mesophilus]
MRRNWTLDEINFLEENVGHIKISSIAQKLNRSEQAVILKLNRIGLSNTKEQFGQLTVGELSRLIKVERKTVCGWIKNYGLKSIKKTTRATKKFSFVDPKDFWKWAEENRERLDFSRIDPHTIPPEPDWVKHERVQDSKVEQQNYKSWTIKEERELRDLISMGMSFKEVAKSLNRTNSSVERKYHRMKSSLKLVQNIN